MNETLLKIAKEPGYTDRERAALVAFASGRDHVRDIAQALDMSRKLARSWSRFVRNVYANRSTRSAPLATLDLRELRRVRARDAAETFGLRDVEGCGADA